MHSLTSKIRLECVDKFVIIIVWNLENLQWIRIEGLFILRLILWTEFCNKSSVVINHQSLFVVNLCLIKEITSCSVRALCSVTLWRSLFICFCTILLSLFGICPSVECMCSCCFVSTNARNAHVLSYSDLHLCFERIYWDVLILLCIVQIK